MPNKKILLVEDDKDFLWILRQSFAGEPLLSVFFAQDGEEGLKMVEKEKPDLVLLDILLPKMDGMEVARKIKEKGFNSQIVFLTNLKDAKHISEAVDIVKETEYILKSDLHVDQIVERIKQKLGVK